MNSMSEMAKATTIEIVVRISEMVVVARVGSAR